MTDNVPAVRKYKSNVSLGKDEESNLYYSNHPRSKESTNEFKDRLPQGKYDIDYSIGICKMMIKHVDDNLLSAGNFGISLKYSINKLMAFLKQEKQGRNKDAVILHTCDKCSQSELIFAKNAKDHECNFCKYDVKFLPVKKL